jgi:hypothetical protein
LPIDILVFQGKDASLLWPCLGDFLIAVNLKLEIISFWGAARMGRQYKVSFRLALLSSKMP